MEKQDDVKYEVYYSVKFVRMRAQTLRSISNIDKIKKLVK